MHAATPAIPSGHSARSEAESRNPHARSDASHPHRSFRAERSGVAESTGAESMHLFETVLRLRASTVFLIPDSRAGRCAQDDELVYDVFNSA
jgi:hypothetical protein